MGCQKEALKCSRACMAAVKLAFEDNENMRRVEEKGEMMKTKERKMLNYLQIQ